MDKTARQTDPFRSILEQMQACRATADPEVAHGGADKLLVALVQALAGRTRHKDVVAQILATYDHIPKWYA